ncbi:MAG: acetylornithine deacetylase [Alphaproteobacteria bacterium]|nr:acetylornithine deacetylase [Alphaproteobacteria bacterium]
MGTSYTPREMIDRLVSFDTTSRDSNLGLIEFVADYLKGHGLEPLLIPNSKGTKANLYVTIGPDTPGGIVLSGHTDVVPVDGQPWTSDPFKTVVRDGKLYGRGTCDMKSFCAIALAFVPRFIAARSKTPIHIALSYDEEIGCLGVRPMIAKVLADLPRPRLVVIGEPSDMQVVNAHKGIRAFTTTVTGKEAHSSHTDKGVNAVMVAAELITFIETLAEDMRRKGDPSHRFDPPYTTVQSSVIEGGTALNILARECTFRWEYRSLPGSDEEEIAERFQRHAREAILPRLRRVAPEADIVTTAGARVPPLKPAVDCPAEALARQLTGRNSSEAVSYGTEAGLFQEAGIPTVVCGPGSILQAHKPDEFIALEQIDLCTQFMQRLADHIAA